MFPPRRILGFFGSSGRSARRLPERQQAAAHGGRQIPGTWRGRARGARPGPGRGVRSRLGAPAWSGVAGTAALACALSAQPVSPAGANSVDSSSAPAPLRPAVVFASIERAWMIGSADSVVEHVGKRKILISLPEGGPEPGAYSRAQSYFIFKEMFDATRTEMFSFVSIREAEEKPHTAVGRAERTFRLRDSSRLQTDRIFVSLVQENDRWVISEIKSIR